MLLFLLPLSGNTQSQDLPEFVQNKLDMEKEETREYLINYRISKNLLWPSYALGVLFSERESYILDSLGLKLHVSMVYDDDMRERMVELLENKYRQYELDTLINRYMFELMDTRYKVRAVDMCKFDTIPFFKIMLDSINKANSNDRNNKYKLFDLLHLDTTLAYQTAYSETVKKDKERIETDYLTDTLRIETYIAELCGYVGDKRFVAPLEKILEREKDNKRVLEALVKMKVEPYYANYLTERTRSIEDIKKEKPRFSLDDFVYVLGNQEAYLELSKYLLSEVEGTVDVIDMPDTTMYSESPIYLEAISLIGRIKNPALQKIINTPNFDKKKESDRLKVYKWMQKNYGKYQIYRIW
jgi:hypothetical protein